MNNQYTCGWSTVMHVPWLDRQPVGLSLSLSLCLYLSLLAVDYEEDEKILILCKGNLCTFIAVRCSLEVFLIIYIS